jgi:hypothetical protein
MPVKKISLAQQRAVARALLTPPVKARLKAHCRHCEQRGEGLLDILGSAGKFLVKNVGDVAKTLGPTVIREIVGPLIRKKIGAGLRPAGAGKKRKSPAKKKRVKRKR